MRILATTDASAVMPRISGFPWDRKSFHACRLPSQNLEHEINILKIRNEQLYAKRDMYTRFIPIRSRFFSEAQVSKSLPRSGPVNSASL